MNAIFCFIEGVTYFFYASGDTYSISMIWKLPNIATILESLSLSTYTIPDAKVPLLKKGNASNLLIGLTSSPVAWIVPSKPNDSSQNPKIPAKPDGQGLCGGAAEA